MLRHSFIAAVLSSSALLLPACGNQVGGDAHNTYVRDATWAKSLKPRIGKDVVVQLRGDAQGEAAIFAVSSPGNPESRLTAYAGTLSAVGEGWVVVKNDDTETWVPMSSILAVHVMDVRDTVTIGGG